MLLDQKVVVKWNPATKKYYESLGYKWTRNGDTFEIDIKDLPKGSDVKVKYICDYCNGKNQINKKDKWKRYADLNKYRELTGKDCCNNKECKKKKMREIQLLKSTPTKGNSLADKFPHIAKEWNYEKNNKTPLDYAPMSHQIVWWKCPKGHEYDMKISDRTHLNANCPYCAGKRIDETNCLANTYPEIAKEWNYNKNKNITPYDISPYSNKKYWWVCEKGHEWKVSVNNRVNNNTGCPYCANQKVCLDNCLATTHPEIAKEWHPIKNGNLTPYDVVAGTVKKVWWICKEKHEWKTPVYVRANMGSGCPICNESKGEKRIRKFLKSNNIKFKSQYEFNDLKGIGGGLLRFDFAIFDDKNNLKMLIEYDGIFHFKKVYKDDSHEMLVEHDKRKNEYCKRNNIPLLRIPYTKYDKIEEILKNILINN